MKLKKTPKNESRLTWF